MAGFFERLLLGGIEGLSDQQKIEMRRHGLLGLGSALLHSAGQGTSTWEGFANAIDSISASRERNRNQAFWDNYYGENDKDTEAEEEPLPTEMDQAYAHVANASSLPLDTFGKKKDEPNLPRHLLPGANNQSESVSSGPKGFVQPPPATPQPRQPVNEQAHQSIPLPKAQMPYSNGLAPHDLNGRPGQISPAIWELIRQRQHTLLSSGLLGNKT